MLGRFLANQKPFRSRIHRSAAVAVIAAAAVLASPSAVYAASWHDISGTTWSDATKWYVSATDRYKDGTGIVSATMSRLPTFKSGAVDGLWFELTNRQGGMIPGNNVSILFNRTGVQGNVSATIPSGTVFRNAFARKTTCQSDCLHDFAGSEYY